MEHKYLQTLTGDLASAPSFPNHPKPLEIQRLEIHVFHNSSLWIVFYSEASRTFGGPHQNTTVASNCTKPYKMQWWSKRWTPGGKGVTTLTDSASYGKHTAEQRWFSKCSQFPKSPQTMGNTASGDERIPQFVVIDRVLFRGFQYLGDHTKIPPQFVVNYRSCSIPRRSNLWGTTQKYHRGVQLHETL